MDADRDGGAPAEAPSPDRQRGRPVAHTSRADDLRAFVNRSLAGQTGTHTRFGGEEKNNC